MMGNLLLLSRRLAREAVIFMLALAVLISMTLLGCSSIQRQPTIGISQDYDIDFAKTACETQSRMHEVGCIVGSNRMATEIESAFRSAFQENHACAGLTLTSYEHASDAAKADWQLTFQIGIKDGELSPKDSDWQVVPGANQKTPAYARGDMGSPFQAASHICAIAKGEGGKVQQQ